MPDPRDRAEAGVLDPAALARRTNLGHESPPDELRGHVDQVWWVTWDAPEPFSSRVIPRPVVHVTAESDRGDALWIHGVRRRSFTRRLVGTGRTVGLSFRPAMFRGLLGRDVASLRDREVPWTQVMAIDAGPGAAAALDPALSPAGAADQLAQAALEWIRARGIGPDPSAEEVAALVERAEHDVTLTRADQLADLAGVSLRTLQRRFLDYVGIGPKWVVQRFRLLDVAQAVHRGEPVDWASLADRLGYADQSHLIRGFTALVGEPPATYAARLHAG